MAKWINPDYPSGDRKGWYEIEGIKPDKFVSATEDEIDDATFGHLFLWNKSCYIRGCDEGILDYLASVDEKDPSFEKKGLLVSDIKERYKQLSTNG